MIKAERFWCWLAWLLPRDLVMWCAVRLMAHGTGGPYGNTDPSDLNVLEALKRWKVKQNPASNVVKI